VCLSGRELGASDLQECVICIRNEVRIVARFAPTSHLSDQCVVENIPQLLIPVGNLG
jgi:hypothetical protein